MILKGAIDPQRRYRLQLRTAAGHEAVELPLLPESASRSTGPRTKHNILEKGFVPNARFFLFDDETQLLSFWQEGKGVAVELSGYVPYAAILGFEPLD